MENIDITKLKEICDLFTSNKLTELKLEDSGLKITMKKEQAPILMTQSVPSSVSSASLPSSLPQGTQQTGDAASASNQCEKEEENQNIKFVKAPLVGTFYGAATPDAPSYANVGDTIKKGQTLCIIEALKMMNELQAEEDCKIIEILGKEGNMVEFGQPLFKVETL